MGRFVRVGMEIEGLCNKLSFSSKVPDLVVRHRGSLHNRKSDYEERTVVFPLVERSLSLFWNKRFLL